MKTNSNFDTKDKYNLYRTVYDIIHPSISKKNISNYKIVVDKDTEPLRVFYPKKIDSNPNIIIFIPTFKDIIDEKCNYSNVCKGLSKESNSIVIGIDYNYDENTKLIDIYNNCYNTIKYLYGELIKNNINKDNITLMGESIGANIINGIIQSNNDIKINKIILINPVVDKTDDIEANKVTIFQLNRFKDFFDKYVTEDDYNNELLFPINNKENNNYPKTLIFIGAADPLLKKTTDFYQLLKDNNVDIELNKITFADHNLLNNEDNDIKDELYKKLNEFFDNE